MTNDEAREQLKDIARSFSREYFHDWREALDVAIKALEQQPSEDCISRQAVIDKATSWDTHFADSERYVSLSDIMALPSVTPQASEEDIHREREQSYMLGYEDASKKFRTEPSEDCISRQDVKEILMKYEKFYDDRCETYISDVTEIESAIEDLPSVTPQRTKGKWIDVNGDKSLFECSKCGDKVCCANNNYCPNCGEKKEEE